MDGFRPLGERALLALLQQALTLRVEGRVVLRDREGLRHGVWIEGGYVVGVHVAGRFDPLLSLLRARGALSAGLHLRCVAALAGSEARSGIVAEQVGSVERGQVREVLREQVVARFEALLVRATEAGHDAGLEPCAVPGDERSVRMPLASLLRHIGQTAPAPCDRDEARRQLRAIALRLHPDRHAHLDAATRARLSEELASATAAYHGFR